MKTKHLLSVLILGVGIVSSFLIMSNAALAQTTAAPAVNPIANIQYPVSELGNCGSETECKTYCDNSAHLDACLSFAESHNLMSAGEIQAAKKFVAVGKGPGGCATKESCNQYCDDASHIDECVAFAEKNNLMSQSQLTEAKQVQAAIKKGAKLPACNGKDACDKYCNDVAHVEECMAFAKAAGFMTPEEIQNSDKVLAAVKKGVKPPACKGSECDKYCSDPAHAEECIAFSEAAGFMTPQEATMARKTGGKGPGGCVGKEQCDAFCNNPDNQETCFNFGRDNGMIPPEQLQKIDEGKKQFTDSLKQAPVKVIDCISGVVGADRLEKFKSGTLVPPKDIGNKVGECFRQGMPPGGPGEGGNIPPAGQGSGDAKPSFQPGPGTTNPGGQMMPQQAGPGGCKTPEECQSFCASNPDVCKNFRPSGEPGNQPSVKIERAPGQSGGNPPTGGMMPSQPCEGDNCKQLAPGGQPGQIQGGTQGELQNFVEGEARKMMQRIQPGTQIQQKQGPSTNSGQAPSMGLGGQGQACAPGTQCGPGFNNTPGQAPAATQPGTFIQTQPGNMIPQGNIIPQGNMMPPSGGAPPPANGSAPPPPPAGGSLLEAVQSFFGL
ncbi:MAG: hypothetical protein ABSE68_00420 [Minisyncoccia bacterium]